MISQIQTECGNEIDKNHRKVDACKKPIFANAVTELDKELRQLTKVMDGK